MQHASTRNRDASVVKKKPVTIVHEARHRGDENTATQPPITSVVQ
jgi:hypothetical protein